MEQEQPKREIKTITNSDDLYIHSLQAIGPVDGRNRIDTQIVSDYFSESAFFRHMLKIEAEYLIALTETSITKKLSQDEKDLLRSIVNNFSLEDAKIMQNIDRFGYKNEGPINHDAKAVEYFLKMKIEEAAQNKTLYFNLAEIKEMIHFALTSNDTKDAATALMADSFVKEVYLPMLISFGDKLCETAQKYREIAMKSRTHGQDSVPTTLGKEFAVFLERLGKEIFYLGHTKLYGKLNGAVGNFNAHVFSAPEIDWIEFSTEFIKKLGLNPNIITTQIEPGDSLVHLFQCIQRINNILLDFSMDMWRYISDDYFIQKKIESEVGSSTMPNKINPIDFEHAEGCLYESNAKLAGFISKIQISRLQRDLSDTPVKRGIGVAFAYSYEALKRLAKGMNRINANNEKIAEELESNYAVLAEAVQTLLRKEGYEKPYERLKAITRGKKLAKEEYEIMIESLFENAETNEISQEQKELKNRLAALTPRDYLGYSAKLVDMAAERWNIYKRGIALKNQTLN